VIAILVAVAVISISATARAASALPAATLPVRGGMIEVQFAQGNFDLPQKAILDHVARAACAVTTYYGRFPAEHYLLVIVPVAGRRGVLSETTWGFGGAHSRIVIGEHTEGTELDNDWVITHEMVHTAFPTMPDENHWIEEGIATYVEPLARSWVGDYPPSKVWDDLISGLPKGLPAAGDEGLDHTHTWGRTYWGGATLQSEWTIDRAFKAGDAATGVPVLEELYAQMRSTPAETDLAGLWMQLGVEARSKVTFDDGAPESAERRAISARPSDAQSGCGDGEPLEGRCQTMRSKVRWRPQRP